MSVSAYVCVFAYVKNDTSRNLLYILRVAVARPSSDDSAISNLLPVLWMTSCFSVISDAKATLTGRILKLTHQGADSGAN